MSELEQISPEQHVLIAGPTASGKSALALEIAAKQGGVIVNADALQIYDNWPILSAHPSAEDFGEANHLLYGHKSRQDPYSVGDWLREIAPILEKERTIVVGGTGLYFSALTEGLAEIPETPRDVRKQADRRISDEGFAALLSELDDETWRRIDIQNPRRVQRAWEVWKSTGKPIWKWQDETPAPLLDENQYFSLYLDAEKDWLNQRIETRFNLMLEMGALDEARANLSDWDSTYPASKTIGALELIQHVRGELSLEQAQSLITIATRQYAKRQRTWLRKRMSHWTKLSLGR